MSDRERHLPVAVPGHDPIMHRWNQLRTIPASECRFEAARRSASSFNAHPSCCIVATKHDPENLYYRTSERFSFLKCRERHMALSEHKALGRRSFASLVETSDIRR